MQILPPLSLGSGDDVADVEGEIGNFFSSLLGKVGVEFDCTSVYSSISRSWRLTTEWFGDSEPVN